MLSLRVTPSRLFVNREVDISSHAIHARYRCSAREMHHHNAVECSSQPSVICREKNAFPRYYEQRCSSTSATEGVCHVPMPADDTEGHEDQQCHAVHGAICQAPVLRGDTMKHMLR